MKNMRLSALITAMVLIFTMLPPSVLADIDASDTDIFDTADEISEKLYKSDEDTAELFGEIPPSAEPEEESAQLLDDIDINLGVVTSAPAITMSPTLTGDTDVTFTTSASGTCGDNLTWKLDNNTLTISGSGAMTNWSSSSDVPWYSNRSSIKSVVIEYGVTSIGSRAFSSCSSLTSISIPDSVTSIGSSAFSICSNLTSITIPDSVTSIGSYAFDACTSLSEITVDSGNRYYKSINGVLFNYSGTTLIKYPAGKSGTSYTIPNSVTSIGNSSFDSCRSLTNITIPDSVTSIYSYAFYCCTSLASVTIPNSVTSIGSGAFRYCSSLTSVTIPNSVTSIGDYAFGYCSSLTSVTILSKNATFGSLIFQSCSSALVINSHSSSTAKTYATDNEYTFKAFTASGTCGDHLSWALTDDGTLYIYGSGAMTDWSSSSDVPWYSNRLSIKSVVIENGVTSIGHNAFWYCSSLTSVTIPDSVTSIGTNAFYQCASLTSITIPNSVTSIYNDAFWYCSSLTSITIPDSVTYIASWAFESCTSLTSVTILSTNVAFGSSLFIGCSSDLVINGYSGSTAETYATDNSHTFKAITADGTCGDNLIWTLTSDGTLTISGSGAMTDWDSSSDVPWYSNRSSIKSVVIENGVTSIGSRAFYERSNLTSVTIPDSVTSIGYRAFYNCTSLTSVTIPASVTSFSAGVFNGCSGLISVTIPAGVASFGSGVFYNCTSLTNVTILSKDATFENNVFYNCASLTNVTILSKDTTFGYSVFVNCSSDLVINGYSDSTVKTYASNNGYTFKAFTASGTCGDDVSWVLTDDGTLYIYGSGAMTDWSSYSSVPWYSNRLSIKSVVIEYGVTSIGSCAFGSCDNLTSVTIPDSVTSIGKSAFYCCSSLANVTIPDSVTSIVGYAFYGCSSLENITIPDSVTSIGSYAFYNCISLTSVTIPDSVTSIYSYAFEGCTSLASITIPDSVTSIGNYAFGYCSSLASITIPDSVTSIGNYAFGYCSSLTSATILFKDVTFGDYVFKNCSSDLVINGYSGSTAETYATDNSHKFNSIGTMYFYDTFDSYADTGLTVQGTSAQAAALGNLDLAVSARSPGGDEVSTIALGTENNNKYLNIVSGKYATSSRGASFSFNSDTNVPTYASIADGNVLNLSFKAKFKDSASTLQVFGLTSNKTTANGSALNDPYLSIANNPEIPTGEWVNVDFYVDNTNNATLIVTDTDGNLLSTKSFTASGTAIEKFAAYGAASEVAIDDLTLIQKANPIKSLTLYIKDDSNAELSGTTVTLGKMTRTLTSSSLAIAVPTGTYSAEVKKNGYNASTTTITLTDAEAAKTINLTLTQNIYSSVPTTITISGGQLAMTAPINTDTVTSTAFTASAKDQKMVDMDNSTLSYAWDIVGADGQKDDNVTIAGGVITVKKGFTAAENHVEEFTVKATATNSEGSATGTTKVKISDYAFYEPGVDSASYGGVTKTLSDGTTAIIIPTTSNAATMTLPNAVTFEQGKAYKLTFNHYHQDKGYYTYERSLTLKDSSGNNVIDPITFCSLPQTTGLQMGTGAVFGSNMDWSNGNVWTTYDVNTWIPVSITFITYSDGTTKATAQANGGEEFTYTLDSGVTDLASFVFQAGNSVDTRYDAFKDFVIQEIDANVVSGTCGDNLSWVLDDNGTLTISGTGAMTDWDSSSDVPWYSNRSSIKSVVIKNGVTSISKYAFFDYSSLTSITIPNSITSIGSWAFYYCTNITNITIPNSVTSIESGAFADCSSLTSATILFKDVTFGTNVFQSCSSDLVINGYSGSTAQTYANDNGITFKAIDDEVVTPTTYTITYNANGGSGAPSSQTIDQGQISALSSTIPTRSGYTFLGWATSSTATSATYQAGASFTADADTTLYAVWTEVTYTIAYNANGGSGAPSSQTKTHGQALTLSSTIPTRSGYTFLGWATSFTATSATYQAGASFTADAYTTLYAVWTEVTYTIAYNANGGSGAPSSQTKTHGQALTLSSTKPTRTGYTFLGWATSSSATSATYQAGASFTTDADTTLYAVWKSTTSDNTENSSLKDGDNGTINSIAWTFSGDTLTLNGSGTMPSFTEGSAPWSNGKKQIKHIIINDNINNIGAYAFAGLEKVVDCSIPSTVETIGSHAFDGCTQLTSPTLPQGLTSIGENAFNGCSAIKEITVPDSVGTIASGAFGGCTSLKKITLPFIGSEVGSKNNTNTFSYIFGTVPNSLKTVIITKETNIPQAAFKGLSNIEQISVNNEVKTIGASAFYGCSALTGFTVPDGVTDIADYTFRGCKSAESIVVPESVQAIGVSAFEGCAKLTDINIPNGIKEIKDNTFKDCASLTKITIPDSVENIGTNVLDGCTSLYTMVIPFVGASRSNSTAEESIFGYLFGKTDNTQIPASVTKVEVTNDKNGVISAGAFENCQNICDIIIDNGYSVVDGAFKNCRNLKTLYLSKDIKIIGDCILEDCTNLRTLTVPFIGSDNNDKNTKTSVLGAFFGYSESLSGTLIKQYYNNNEYLFYYVPETLKNVTVLRQTDLPYGAFMNCQNIEQISIITGAAISDKAFYDCVALKKISLPKDATTIGNEAFSGCESLEYINIPASTTSIGEKVFYNANIKEITIPANVTNIDDKAFNGGIGNDTVIYCAEGSAADIFAQNHNIEPKYRDAKMLDVKKTLTSIDVHSDKSLFLDITDTNKISGDLYAVLYDTEGAVTAVHKIQANGSIEYKITFTEKERKDAVTAKIFIWNSWDNENQKMNSIVSQAEVHNDINNMN